MVFTRESAEINAPATVHSRELRACDIWSRVHCGACCPSAGRVKMVMAVMTQAVLLRKVRRFIVNSLMIMAKVL
jgi:hypothetical protein